MLFANDLGYSSVKANVDGEDIKFPSAIARITDAYDYEPISFSDKARESVYMDDFMNHLLVSINSSAVSLQGKYMVGEAAVESSLPMIKFDVNDFSGKSESDLAPFLSLSTIAGKAVQNYYQKRAELPESLDVKVDMATALPVSEGKRKGIADNYKNKFLGKKHVVMIDNFENPITVNVLFDHVYVGLEGELAQLFIANADTELKGSISKYLKAEYTDLAKSLSVEDLIGLKDILSLDIGGGTVDSVAVINGVANANASDSLKFGFGNVLQEAVSVLQNKKINFDDRTELQEYLLTKPNVITQDKYDYVNQIVMETAETFIEKIVNMVSQTLRKAGSQVSVVYVYGGGANALFQSSLKDQLKKKLSEFNGDFEIPIIWIGDAEAQYLNRKGLQLVSKALFSGKSNEGVA